MLAPVKVRTAAIVLLTVASLLLVAGALIGGAVGTGFWALLVPAVPTALAICAAPPRATRALVIIGLLGGLTAALLWVLATLPGGPGPRPFGLPPATWWMLIGLGVVPLVGVPLVFAAGFRAVGSAAAEGD